MNVESKTFVVETLYLSNLHDKNFSSWETTEFFYRSSLMGDRYLTRRAAVKVKTAIPVTALGMNTFQSKIIIISDTRTFPMQGNDDSDEIDAETSNRGLMTRLYNASLSDFIDSEKSQESIRRENKRMCRPSTQ